MDWHQIGSMVGKFLPIAIIAGLFADWLRLRFARRAEERKHIARATSDLLEMRYYLSKLPELSKHLPELMPKELQSQLPPDIWRCIDFAPLLPIDAQFADRYRQAVNEIAGFRPVLAFKLRGKERYFDFRNFLSKHFSQSPGSPLVASRITEALDRELLAPLDETLSLLAQAHGIRMRLSIALVLKRRPKPKSLFPPAFRETFQNQILQLIQTDKSRSGTRIQEFPGDHSI